VKFFATKKKSDDEALDDRADAFSADQQHASDPFTQAMAAGGADASDRTQRILRAIGATSGPADRPVGQATAQTQAPARTQQPQPVAKPAESTRQSTPNLSGGAATIQFPARQDHPDLAATFDDAASSRLSQATVTGDFAQSGADSMPSVRRTQDEAQSLSMARASESASALLGPTAAQQLAHSRPPAKQSAVVLHKNVSQTDHRANRQDAGIHGTPIAMETATVAPADVAPNIGAQPQQSPADQNPARTSPAHEVAGEQATAQAHPTENSRPDSIGQPANDRVMEHAISAQTIARQSNADQNLTQGAKASPSVTEEAAQGPVQPDPPARRQAEQAWSAAETPKGNDDPLLDCLVIMTAIFERPHSPDALSAGLPLVDDRLTPELFVRAAGRAGLSARIVRRGLTDITNLSLPAVLLLKGGKACVLIKQDSNGKASVVLPETGQGVTQISTEKLVSMFAGYVIFAKPEFQFDKRSEATEMRPTKDWFWGTLKKFWRIYAQVGVAALFVNLFAIATPTCE